jgi:hypothetical protein
MEEWVKARTRGARFPKEFLEIPSNGSADLKNILCHKKYRQIRN